MNLATTVKESVPVEWRRTIKIRRALVAEAFGSWRYSSPALNDLDHKLVERIGSAPGVFLEIGANDGYSQSNTYLLERRYGWRGILVEPLPALAAWCRRVRTASVCMEVACTSVEGASAKLKIADRNLTSVVLGQQDRSEECRRLEGGSAGVVQVSGCTLSEVIDQCREVHLDLISVDVEGSEERVLSGLDFTRHTPSWLLVETKVPERVAELCGRTMVFSEQLSHHDYLFRSK